MDQRHHAAIFSRGPERCMHGPGMSKDCYCSVLLARVQGRHALDIYLDSQYLLDFDRVCSETQGVRHDLRPHHALHVQFNF